MAIKRATKTRQYDLLQPRVGQKKSHQDSAVRFAKAKSWPERATETRQYDLLRPRVGQKEPPRLGSTICYGQTWVHRDSAAMICCGQDVGQKEPPRLGFVTAKSWPGRATETRQCYLLRPRVWQERATKTRQYDMVRTNVCQKKPPRLGSTICYGQELARKSHQDSAVRFVTAKSRPERATKTRQYDLLRPRVGQKKPPRLGSTICDGQELARKSHQDSAVRFVTAKNWPEKATKTRQYDLLRSNVGQKEPPRLGSTICYGQEFGQKEPPRLGSTICYGQTCARRSHQDSAIRFVAAKNWPERATKTRQYDLLRPRVCSAKRGPERATKTRQYDLLRPNVGQKEPSRLGSTICYGQTWARKSHQDSAVRFVTAKRGPGRATKTRQYDLLRPRIGQKEPPRLGSTICYGQEFVQPNVGQKEPPRLGSTICYGQELARKSHQDSAVRFVAAKNLAIKRATKTRQYDLLRPRIGQKKPPRLGSTICYGQQKEPPRLGSTMCYCQMWARKSHQDSAVRFVTANRKSHRDSAVRFVTAKRGPERATETRQYDLVRPRVGQKEPPRLGSTI